MNSFNIVFHCHNYLNRLHTYCSIKTKFLILFYHFDITIPENHHEVLILRFPDSQPISLQIFIMYINIIEKKNHEIVRTILLNEKAGRIK